MEGREKYVEVEALSACVHPKAAARHGICNAIGKTKMLVTPRKREELGKGEVLSMDLYRVWPGEDPWEAGGSTAQNPPSISLLQSPSRML